MFWCSAYLVVATVVAVSLFVAACWFREQHIVAPDYSGVISALAGAFWPVVLVGMTEFALVYWAFRGAAHAPPPVLSSLTLRH